MEAGKRSIENIFNKGRVLEIPFFQRSYVWEKENWERFISDMQLVSEQNKDYFMGSIILKSKSISSKEDIGDFRTIVDGQQRLTTLILFFKVLCKVQKKQELFKSTFYNRTKDIILKHNHNDIRIFESIINNELSESLKKEYESNNLLNCFYFFQEKENVLEHINIHSILNKLYFVGIDLGTEEDEQQIFDTINSLGVSLTTAELLKNDLFKREDEDLYNNTWKSMFENDEDTKVYWDQEVTSGRQRRVNIDLLLQSFLLYKSNAQEKYLGLDSLFINYKTFIKDNKIDTKTMIKELMEYAKIYKNNIDPDLLNQDINKNSPIERINAVVFGLNTTTVIPFILYLLKEVSSKEEQNKMFCLLESYLMRRLICKDTTKNYNNMFASFIRNKICSYKLLHEKIYKSEDPTNRFPEDDVLKKGFFESNLTNQQAKVIFYLIEKSTRDEKYSTNLMSMNDYSIEHIMPKKWNNNWDKISEERAKKRDQILLKLGNLTIITQSLNSAIRDASWDIKIKGKGDKKGLNEYAKGIKIFDKYLEYKKWDEKVIEQRSNELYKFSIGIWKY